MFSGKSTALIAEAKKKSHRGKIAYLRVNLKVMGMKPIEVSTRNGDKTGIMGHEIPKDLNILGSGVIKEDTVALFIDEYQFFDIKTAHNQLISIIKTGIDVYISGLSTDWTGKIFESVAFACCEADKVFCLTAICEKTKKEASHSWKNSGDFKKRFEQGNHYIAVSRDIFYKLWEKREAVK